MAEKSGAESASGPEFFSIKKKDSLKLVLN
jgi:hypothetical protein